MAQRRAIPGAITSLPRVPASRVLSAGVLLDEWSRVWTSDEENSEIRFQNLCFRNNRIKFHNEKRAMVCEKCFPKLVLNIFCNKLNTLESARRNEI